MAESNSLPTERDFDPWRGDLDAQCAWRNFGGLTIDQAEAKFRQNPEFYQEDFMFMGGKAFAYYFSVIENYLRAVPDVESDDESDDDHQSWILAHCIREQYDRDNPGHLRHLSARVLDLAGFVHNNIRRFGADDEERRRVADAWIDLVRQIQPASKL